MPASRTRVYLLTAFVVAANVLGNFALSWGMKHPNGLVLTGIGPVDALINPWVFAGIILLAVWTLSRVTLLSWADLSFVLPVTSIGYVLNAVIGHFFLNEAISLQRWLGTALILSGTILTAATPPRAESKS
jgi:uncharacterized membrane protein